MFQRVLAILAAVFAVTALAVSPARSEVTHPGVVVNSDLGYLGCLDAVDGSGRYCVAAQRLEDGVHVILASPASPSDPIGSLRVEEYIAPIDSLKKVTGMLGGPAVKLHATLPGAGRVHIVSDSRTAAYTAGTGPGTASWWFDIASMSPWPAPAPEAIIGFQTSDSGSIGGVAVRSESADGFHNANWVGPVSGAFTRV